MSPSRRRATAGSSGILAPSPAMLKVPTKPSDASAASTFRATSSTKDGPCGFEICRYLFDKRLDCMIAAPLLIPMRAGDGVKTDRRDAVMPARLRRVGDIDIHLRA